MAYTSHMNTAQVAGTDRTQGLIADLKSRWTKWRIYRRTLNELRELSPRELNDLGLNGSMLTQVAHEAAYGEAN